MKMQTQEPAQQKTPAVAHAMPELAQVKSAMEDARPEAATLQRLHNIASDSPRTTQYSSLQAAMNASPRVHALQTMQARACHSATAVLQRDRPNSMAVAPPQRLADEEPLQGKFGKAQRVEDEELLQGKFKLAQRAEEGESLQGMSAPTQRQDDGEFLQGRFDPVQRMMEDYPMPRQEDRAAATSDDAPVQREARPNNTGMPDQLKSGIEALSGMNMDHVKVHYNSDQPAQLQAYAYAQGSEIHVATGQEQHLPHEAWHVVQQAQGRVQPTLQMSGGVVVNDDVGLESEADLMGANAIFLQAKGYVENISGELTQSLRTVGMNDYPKQAIWQRAPKRAIKKLSINTKRPSFRSAVGDMREAAKEIYPDENIHMAHRLSWESIRNSYTEYVEKNNTAKIDALIQNLCIPQRDFGDPNNGGVAKGNLEFYNAVVAVKKKYPQDIKPVLTILNSSPYNLRPGDGSTNSSIGGDPDAHFDETQAGEPMTPQSRALLPGDTVDSSDFMNMHGFAEWEQNFYNNVVLSAIESAKRL